MVAKEKNAMRIVALDARAMALNLYQGQTLADARAMRPGLDVQTADPDGDQEALSRFADWARRYTPLVGVDGTDGLMLDITGCAHLFGGEAALLKDIQKRFHRFGFTAKVGLAETVGAAWAMARHAVNKDAPPIIAAGMVEETLSPMPCAALRLDEAVVDTLRRLGLTRVGQIITMPRAPLENRFRQALVMRLDQAFGRLGESITPRLPIPDAMAERRFPEPATMTEEVTGCLYGLGLHIKERLEERGMGARRFDLTLFGVDGRVEHISVGTSRPLRDPERIAKLFFEKLDALAESRQDGFDTGYGFDLIRLSALTLEQLAEHQTEGSSAQGFAGSGIEEEAFADLSDRLTARLGREAVLHMAPHESHIPERAAHLHPAIATRKDQAGWSLYMPKEEGEDASPERPLRLFVPAEPIDAMAEIPEGPPLRFRWRKITRSIARMEGPERIAPEWWRFATSVGESNNDNIPPSQNPRPQDQVSRDYFRIEDDKGTRYWVYRDGLYERETTDPKWFVHGIFG